MRLSSFQPFGLVFITLVAFFSAVSSAQARVWLVGPDFQYRTPSAAIKLAKDGDTIKILAGLYENDYAIIRQNNLTLMGMDGFAHIKSSGPIPGGKAIWTINGNNITIRNIEFSGARVPDRNGAGIRLQTGSLELDNCYFHDNEMGLLTSNNSSITLFIENSEFSKNTQDYPVTGRLSHNIYVGQIALFTLENSISRGAKFGHAVKSRAQNTVIRNSRIFDEGDISSSYLIDIPNGGWTLIENNYLYKNRGARNNALISYGTEGLKYKDNTLTIRYNTAINEGGMAHLLRNRSNIDAEITNNELTGILSVQGLDIEKDGFLDRLKQKIRSYFE